jgi:hypothetical protein
MKIAHAIGNLKPSHLRQVEKSTWRLVMRIGGGESAIAEIRAFLLEFQTMMEAWRADYDNPPSFDFFKLCK